MDYERDLSLQLSGHLRAKGKPTSVPSLTACFANQTIAIQRMTRSGWKLVRTTVTGPLGLFKIRLGDKQGTYRALVDSFEVDDTKYRVENYSPERRHRH